MNSVGICIFSQWHGSDFGEDELGHRRDGTMRKLFAAAVGSAAALAGLAGAANASAAIDLTWAATGTNEITPSAASDLIQLNVILTAGPAGSMGAGISVDFSGAAPSLSPFDFRNTTAGSAVLSFTLGVPTDTGSRIENINGSSFSVANIGLGLPAGASDRLGTITFHIDSFPEGTFEIRSDANAPTDGVLDLIGSDITDTATFNSAFVTLPEPNALMALGSGIAMLALLYRRRRHPVER